MIETGVAAVLPRRACLHINLHIVNVRNHPLASEPRGAGATWFLFVGTAFLIRMSTVD